MVKKSDISAGIEKFNGLTKTRALVTARMSEQDKASIQAALEESTLEINEAQVSSDWTGDTYIVSRPLVRVYVPLPVLDVTITSDLNLVIRVDRSVAGPGGKAAKEDAVSAQMKAKDNATRIGYILSVLDQLKRTEVRELFSSGDSNVVRVRALALQISTTISESKIYPIPLYIEKKVVSTLAEGADISVKDLYEKITSGEIGSIAN